MLAGSLIPLLDPLCEFLQSVCWADRAVKSSTLRTAAWRMPMVGRFGMPRRIEIPALVDAVVMGVIAVLDQVIATLRLGTVDVVRRPQLLDAERDLGIEIGVVVLEIAQPDAFQPNHAGWRFLVMELVPFVRIAGTRIEGVAGLEKRRSRSCSKRSATNHTRSSDKAGILRDRSDSSPRCWLSIF